MDKQDQLAAVLMMRVRILLVCFIEIRFLLLLIICLLIILISDTEF